MKALRGFLWNPHRRSGKSAALPDRNTHVGHVLCPTYRLLRIATPTPQEVSKNLDENRHTVLSRLLVAEPAEVRLQAQRLARQAHTNPAALPLPLSALLNLLETVLVYRLPSLTPVEIQAMLGLTHADLKQSWFYQEVFEEGQKEDLEEGLERGLEEGLEKGRRQESISMVLRLLQRRLGALPLAQEEQVRRLSLTQTETLAEALLGFQTPRDLAEWLNQSQ